MKKMAVTASLVAVAAAVFLATRYWNSVAPALAAVPWWGWLCLVCIWWSVQYFSPLSRVKRAAGHSDESWEVSVTPAVKLEIRRLGASPFIELFEAYGSPRTPILDRISDVADLVHSYGLNPYVSLVKKHRDAFLMLMAGLGQIKARLHGAEEIENYGNVLAEILGLYPNDQRRQTIIAERMVPVVAQWSETPKQFESDLREVLSMPAAIDLFGNLPKVVAQPGVTIDVIREVESVLRDITLEKRTWTRVDDIATSQGIRRGEALVEFIKPYQRVETLLSGKLGPETPDRTPTGLTFPKSLSAAWALIDRFSMELFERLANRLNSGLSGVCLGLVAIQAQVVSPNDIFEPILWRRGLELALSNTREPYYEDRFVATHSGQGIDPPWDEYESILQDPDQDERNAIKHAQSAVDQSLAKAANLDQ